LRSETRCGAEPRLLFLLAKDQEIPLGISNETGQREAMPAREAGVFKMKEFHFERVLEKEAKRRMAKDFHNIANSAGKAAWFGGFLTGS
jgi:hypothetical protein